MAAQLTKSANGDLPYTFYYDRWSLFEETPIVSASISSTPSGLTISTPAVSDDGKAVSVRISGGTAGISYTITLTPETSEGYQEDFTSIMVIT
jgi:hypothetical protein